MKLGDAHSAFLFEIAAPGRVEVHGNFCSENLGTDEYIGIWICDIPSKKIFIESEYHYLKHTHTFRWSLYDNYSTSGGKNH